MQPAASPTSRAPRPASEETVFDLASLTKVIVTTTLAMQLEERRALRLSDPVSAWVTAWRGRDRAHVRVRDLLEHCSGLTAWMPFYRDQRGRADMTEAICALPLEYVPWTRAIYSDLGFMLLGFILEDCRGHELDQQFAPTAEGLDSALRRARGMARTDRPNRNGSLAWAAAVR